MISSRQRLALIIFHRLRGSTSSRPGWYSCGACVRTIDGANLATDIRKKFEIYGENVIAQAVANPEIGMGSGDLPNLIRGNYASALDWLSERRDVHERREDRLETVELAILFAVVVGVAADLAIVAHEFGWL